METMKVQAQIRQNAEEVSSYLSDMSKWEKTINKKPAKRVVTAPRAAPVRPGSGTVKVIEKALVIYDTTTEKGTAIANDADYSMQLTPATLAERNSSTTAPVSRTVPAARGVANLEDAETAERTRGNTEYESGNFTAAIKSYTKCLGLKNKNYVAFSNRAMAYMKLKEYHRAEMDTTCALSIEPTHAKSLIRRATSRNALGKHRAALLDLLAAVDLEPSNKQVRGEIQRTKELLRSAVSRAPLVAVPVVWLDNEGSNQTPGVQSGPDLPYYSDKINGKNDEIKEEMKEEIKKVVEEDAKEEEIIEKVEQIIEITESNNITENNRIKIEIEGDDDNEEIKNENENGNENENEKIDDVHKIKTEESWEIISNQKGENENENEMILSQNNSEDSNFNGIISEKNENKEKKVMKPKAKTVKSEKTEKVKIINGYELEKKLKLCEKDDCVLELFLDGLKPSSAGKMFDNLLEVDIVVSFLVCMERWCILGKDKNEISNVDTDRNNKNSNNTTNTDETLNKLDDEKNVPSLTHEIRCKRMITWYEEISKISSFRILKLLLTQNQREILNETVENGQYFEDKTSSAALLMKERIVEIKSLWQF